MGERAGAAPHRSNGVPGSRRANVSSPTTQPIWDGARPDLRAIVLRLGPAREAAPVEVPRESSLVLVLGAPHFAAQVPGNGERGGFQRAEMALLAGRPTLETRLQNIT